MENNTGKYPDIMETLPNSVLPDTKSFILDCEITAYDAQEDRLLPFQVRYLVVIVL